MRVAWSAELWVGIGLVGGGLLPVRTSDSVASSDAGAEIG